MTARLTSRDRLSRLLGVVPWVVQQPDGAHLDELSKRFDYPRDQLIEDLTEILFFVGVWPYTPDTLIEVEIVDDRVYLHNTMWFSQPMRLTTEESVRLMTAGRSALSVGELTEPTGDEDDVPHSALLRALAKLGTAMGESGEQAVDVRLGHDPGDIRGVLRHACAEQLLVEISYHSYARDAVSQRTIEPLEVFSEGGNWYLSAFCRTADDYRTFRLDRIATVTLSTERFVRAVPTDRRAYHPLPTDPTVTLRLSPAAHWVAAYYPAETTETHDQFLDVCLKVSAQPWLDRLLLRLGDEAEVLDLQPPLDLALTRDRAQRILARYRDGS